VIHEWESRVTNGALVVSAVARIGTTAFLSETAVASATHGVSGLWATVTIVGTIDAHDQLSVDVMFSPVALHEVGSE
jgi:hypothetical protein